MYIECLINHKNSFNMKKLFKIFFAILFTLIATITNAQVVTQSESFEGTIFPAPGWKQIKVPSNLNANFSRQGVLGSLNPTVGSAPSGGLNVMMLNSFSSGSASVADTAVMVTKPFDFSNNGGIDPSFSFYVYRDGGFSANDDHVRVYINTTPSLLGSTLLTNTSGVNKISRYNVTFPAVAANTWNQYTYNLPSATYNQKKYYFIIVGVARGGNNMYLDLFNTNTYPSTTLASDVSFNIFLQNSVSVGANTTNNMIVGVRCIVGGNSGCGVVNGAVSTAVKLDSLLFNTNGTTNVLNIQNAKVWYTGGSNLFSTGYVSPFPITAGSDDYPSSRFGQTIAVPGTNLDFINASTSCFYLEYDTTYFWLTYDIVVGATGGNFVDADFRGSSVGGTPGTCPSPPFSSTSVQPDPNGFSIPGASQIDLPYCIPTYTIGTSFQNYVNNDYINSVVLVGVPPTVINTNFGNRNNNAGLPTTLACYPLCNFTAHPPDYELWPAVPGRTATLQQGTSYVLSVQAGTWFSSNNIRAWIDYNRDGDFVDAGEALGGVSLAALATGNINFTVPAVGYTGITRLRVREVWSVAVNTIDPCAQYTYGETEDFTIIITPTCPVGFKLWLGNTEDWFDPANWCGGVPTINDDVVINKSIVPGVSGRPYFNPVIKSSNIQANCNNISISNSDTLIINAPTPFTTTFKIKGVLTNNGQFKVINSFNKEVTYSNGTIAANVYTPFKALSSDARTQIIYSQSELTLEGLIAGDRITAIKYNIRAKGSNVNYSNFNVSYALVPFNQHATSTPYAGPFTNVFGPTSYGVVLGQNIINLTTPIIWDGSSNILIQYCFDNASNIGSNDDVMFITQTTGRKSTLVLSTPSNVSSGCSLLPGVGVNDNFFNSAGSTRPNFTFVIDRPYGKPTITSQNNWLTNGSFVPGNSLVIMDSIVTPQIIGGSQPTTFHELNVSKTSTTNTIQLQNDILVTDTLSLTQGCVSINGKSITISNPSATSGTLTNPTGPISRTNGFIVSESSNLLPNLSYVKWNVGTTTGYRIIPFGTNITSPTYIPFSFLHTIGDLGVFSVATYNTPVNNQPYPPDVTHLNIFNSPIDNSANVVDRFWVTDKTGIGVTQTSLTFRWPDIENSIGMSAINPPRAQPWKSSTNFEAWLRISNFGGVPAGSTLAVNPAIIQSTAVILGSVDSTRVSNWTWPTLLNPAIPIGNYVPWALSNNNTPLPIELADFNAYKVNDKVRISWVTLSESNNSHFIVERYDENLSNYKQIDVVNSYFGNSNEILNYQTWDNDPLLGLQFYRLKQVDYDGNETDSEYRSVNFGTRPSLEIVNLFGNGLINLEVETNNSSPLRIKIIDVNGKVLLDKQNVPTIVGSNKFLIDLNLSNGVYFVIIEDGFQIKQRKFFK